MCQEWDDHHWWSMGLVLENDLTSIVTPWGSYWGSGKVWQPPWEGECRPLVEGHLLCMQKVARSISGVSG